MPASGQGAGVLPRQAQQPDSNASAAPKPGNAALIRRIRGPQRAVFRFFAKRVLRSALLWGLVFSVYVASSAYGYVRAYPSLHAREQVASSFGNNVGLKALLGAGRHLETAGGFTAWRALGLLTIVGSIWALLLAARLFRGEEEAGRAELFLSGQTSMRRTAVQTLAAIGVGLAAIFVIVLAATAAIGRAHDVSFTFSQSLLLAAAMVAGPAQFAAVGACVSQLMPVRSRAATAGAAVFGLAFVLRAMGDVATSTHWLLNLSPLGWIENLHPLTQSDAWWLLPIGLFVAVLASVSMWLAGRRDLGDSTFADRDTARPHLMLLGSPLGLAVRLTRASTLGWLLAIMAMSFLFGTVTKSAEQLFGESGAVAKISHSLLTQQAKLASAETYLAVVLLIVMVMIMIYAAGAVANVRQDEAQGYLDNLLVRPVARTNWLLGRTALIAVVTLAAGVLSGIMAWLGAEAVHAGVGLHELVIAGINCAVPGLLLIGASVFALGWLPRLTSAIGYGVIAWGFLVEMLGSAINLNHWIVDTSPLHHIALAPAVPVHWRMVWTFVAIGAGLLIVGWSRFVKRDLQTE